MKIQMIKQPGGVFVPASDLEADKLTKFKTGEQYEIEIKLTRNAAFHRKVFAFFNFCFDHWKGDNEFQCEQKQFNVFRDHLTVLAGFCDELYNINGELRIEAKSISFGKMSQEEFELLYNALINSAIKHIFPNCDQNTIDQLYNFF